MQKRITLLRKRPDLTVDDFRRHWAEPHAAIARRFSGLVKYNQNRVEAELAASGPVQWHIDGVVELWFCSPSAMSTPESRATTDALIEDEPRFLSGLTALRAGESWATEVCTEARKTMALAIVDDPDAAAQEIVALLEDQVTGGDLCDFAVDRVKPAFTREALWSEPDPPNLIVWLWTSDDSAEDGTARALDLVRGWLERTAVASAALSVNELRIVEQA